MPLKSRRISLNFLSKLRTASYIKSSLSEPNFQAASTTSRDDEIYASESGERYLCCFIVELSVTHIGSNSDIIHVPRVLHIHYALVDTI